jgi:rhomboid protease GluP
MMPIAGDPAPPPTTVTIAAPVQRVWSVYGWLAAIILVFLIQFSFNPVGAGSDPVIQWGAKSFAHIARGEWWRLFTPIFIHASFLHFAFNAYALYQLGRQLERVYGAARFSAVMLVTGLAGNVLSLWFTPAPSIGASGAIFGLIGAEAVWLYRNRVLLGARGRANLQSILSIAAINLLLGLQGGIDNWGHMGGLLGGLLLGWVIGPVWAFEQEPFTTPRIVDQNPFTFAQGAIIGLNLLGWLGLAFLALLFDPFSLTR